MNAHTVRPLCEFIREPAQKAAAAPDAAGKAIEGARGLLPSEVFWFTREPSAPRLQHRLYAAVAHRMTICNDELVWDHGMEEIGPNLLALVGYAPEGRNFALQVERNELEKLRFTDLERDLVDLLGNAVRISVLKRDLLSRQLIELFQQQGNFEAGERLYRRTTKELWAKGGSAEISIMLNTKGHLAALKLRFRRDGVRRSWVLPPSLGSELLPRIEALIDQ